MSIAVRLSEYRQRRRPVFFTRAELNLILSLYARMVALGQWRDYALDQHAGMAVFSVFRRSQELPLFTIAKCSLEPARGPSFLVYAGPRRLAAAADLGEALAVIERKPCLVAM
ncbi:MAG: DUF2794 domain-containing protein [Thalassobaculales bacterium]